MLNNNAASNSACKTVSVIVMPSVKASVDWLLGTMACLACINVTDAAHPYPRCIDRHHVGSRSQRQPFLLTHASSVYYYVVLCCRTVAMH